MGVAENIERVKRFYAAGPADRDEEREGFFATDAVWHVPGDNPVSGDYHGVEEIATQIAARMQPLDSWVIEPRHVMGNVDYVVAVLHVRGERRGHKISVHGSHVFRFDADGQIAEAWGFTDDQDAVDTLFRA